MEPSETAVNRKWGHRAGEKKGSTSPPQAGSSSVTALAWWERGERWEIIEVLVNVLDQALQV